MTQLCVPTKLRCAGCNGVYGLLKGAGDLVRQVVVSGAISRARTELGTGFGT